MMLTSLAEMPAEPGSKTPCLPSHIHSETYSILCHCLSHHAQERTAAEHALQSLLNNPSVSFWLMQIALCQDLPLSNRQLAAVTLKGYLDTHWCSSTARFIGPEPTEQVKGAVRSNILTGLGDPLSKIRVSLAHVISKMAHLDWPEMWPDLLDVLLQYLKESPHHVHGAMRVLIDFVGHDLTEQHVPIVAPVLLPELCRIFTQPQTFSVRVRARAAFIVKEFSKTLFHVRDSHPHQAEACIQPMIQTWIPLLQQCLSEQTVCLAALPVQMESVLTLIEFHRCFRQSMATHTPSLLETVWKCILDYQSVFIRSVVNQHDIMQDECDSEGHVLNMETFLSSLFDFVGEVAMEKSIKKLFGVLKSRDKAHEPCQQLIDFCQVFLSFMQMTEHQIEMWSHNVGEFISVEEEVSFSFSLRKKVLETLADIAQEYNTDFLKALNLAMAQLVAQGNHQKSAGDVYWWKLHEACLYGVGQLSGEIIESVKQNMAVHFDVSGLFQHVLSPALEAKELPFLQGRALWFASKFAEILPSDKIHGCVQAAVGMLQTSQHDIVKVFAIKALRSFCEFGKKTDIDPFAAPLLEGLIQSLIQVAQQNPEVSVDWVSLILDSLIYAVKLNDPLLLAYEHGLTPLLLSVWAKYSFEMLVVETIQELFESLCKNKLSFQAFENRVLIAVHGLLEHGYQIVLEEEGTVQGHHDSISFADVQVPRDVVPSMLASGIELLVLLLKHSTEMNSVHVEHIFPCLIRLVHATRDNSILQCGQEYLTLLVQRDFSRVAQWKDTTGKSGLEWMIQFLAKLLNPQEEESAAMFIGDLITKLILKGGSALHPVLLDLLRAVALRLETAKSPSFIQTLVLVFAQLFVKEQYDPNVILDFLSQLGLSQGQSGLDVLLQMWCDNHSSFMGYYAVKVRQVKVKRLISSSVALSKLVSRQDVRLSQVMVKGDLIVSSSDRIITRSRSKKEPDQFTTVAFPVKVVKLLLSDYLQHSEQPMAAAKAGLSMCMEGPTDDSFASDEEGDWEDVEPAKSMTDAYLHDLIDEAGFGSEDAQGDEAEDDPDIQNDPIYQYDMKTYLASFFKSSVIQNPVLMQVSSFLTTHEQQQLYQLVQ